VFRNLTVRATGKSRRELVVGVVTIFEIMASVATVGFRPTSGGNQRPDSAATRTRKKNARYIESWWRHLHLTRPCTVTDKLTNGLRAPRCPERGRIFIAMRPFPSASAGRRAPLEIPQDLNQAALPAGLFIIRWRLDRQAIDRLCCQFFRTVSALGGRLLRFGPDSQPELDQATDGLGAAGFVGFAPRPSVDRSPYQRRLLPDFFLAFSFLDSSTSA
jgi:hypothetical protein